MSFVIGAITLPRIPENIRYRVQADTKELRYPSNKPIIIVYGDKADILSLEGRLSAAGTTKAQILTNYVGPLEALVHTEVVIDYNNRPYDGLKFIFMDFEWEERPGLVRTIYYKMQFARGEVHIVI